MCGHQMNILETSVTPQRGGVHLPTSNVTRQHRDNGRNTAAFRNDTGAEEIRLVGHLDSDFRKRVTPNVGRRGIWNTSAYGGRYWDDLGPKRYFNGAEYIRVTHHRSHVGRREA